MSINHIFEELAATSSRNEKEAILTREKGNALLQEAIHMALNPFIQFYIRKIPSYVSAPKAGLFEVTLKDAMKDLYPLSTRTVTGHAAIKHLTNVLSSLDEEDAKVIERIIAKDLKCGVAESTVNKIWKNFIPEYPCMLASQYDEKLLNKIHWPAFAQLKSDGMRFNAIIRNGTIEYRSRNGKELFIPSDLGEQFLSFATTARTLLKVEDVVFDGELLVRKNGEILPRKIGNGILNKANKGTISEEEAADVVCRLWDVIPYENFAKGSFALPYQTRLGYLQQCHHKHSGEDKILATPNHVVNTIADAQDLFKSYLDEGEEGIIVKDPKGIWENKRAKHLIKFKSEKECDLEVVGWLPGTGKYVDCMGALQLQSADGVIRVDVGSGFTDEQRHKYTQKAVMGKIVAVKYNERITNEKGQESLFLPIFIELRPDKDRADSSKSIK